MDDLQEQSQQDLEEKYRQRSEELERLNSQLRDEIARHRETSRLLRENNEVLESILANTHLLIAYLDRDFNFIRVNEAYAKASGKGPAFFVGKNHFDLYPHNENEAIFRRVVETGETYSLFERPYASTNDRGGQELNYWDLTLQPVKNEEGETEGLILTLIDATKRKNAEEEVKLRHKRYQDLMDQSLDGLKRTDMEGFIIEANESFKNMVGYTDDELRSMTYKDITPAEWQRHEDKMFEWLGKRGYTPIYEKEYMGKGGNKIPVELRTYLTRDEKGRPKEMWSIVRDITQKRETEKKLQDYMRQLKQSNLELKEFANVTSHDLQEPLRKIQTFGNRLVNKYRNVLDENARDYLDRMVNASTRMRGLIDALLTYSRASRQSGNFSMVDMNEVVREALNNLEQRVEDKKAKVEAADMPEIEGDRVRLVQLIQNLIGNSLKFQRNGVPPIVRVDCSIKNSTGNRKKKTPVSPDLCEIRVEDNGIGLDKEYAESIFLPFHRLHGRTQYQGAGMGLAICRRIVDLHKGDIRVESVPGKGSTFIVTIPMKQEDGTGRNG